MNTASNPFNETLFTSQVSELARLLNEFSGVLDNEAQAIKKNDAERLLKSNTSKQQIAEQLNQAGNALETTLAVFSTNLIDFSVHDYFATLPENTQEQVKEVINLTVDCHDKNLANGMSIQILSNINQNALDLISGKGKQDVKLYGASGEKTQSGDQKSLGKA